MYESRGSSGAARNSIRSQSSIANPAAAIAAARVAREVTARGDRRPQAGPVGQREERALRLPPRDHVLVEAQLAAGAHHPRQLRQRPLLVGDAAEHEADHAGVQLTVREGQRVRESRDAPSTGTAASPAASTASARSVGSGSIATTSATVGG